MHFKSVLKTKYIGNLAPCQIIIFKKVLFPVHPISGNLIPPGEKYLAWET